MNRRDPNTPRWQAGSYADEQAPRQTGQWQNEPSRQAGGGRDYDDERSDGYLLRDAGQSGRPRPSSDAAGDTRYTSLQREYRGDPRQDSRREELDGPRRYRGDYSQTSYDATYGNDFSNFTSEDYGGRDFYARRSGMSGGMAPSDTYRPSYGLSRGSWFGHDDDAYGDWRSYGERRGFFERAGDEIASWFGDEDAARRRDMDHRGRGPSDYTRSDERIREDVNDRLTHDWRIDARNVRVTVSDGEVTLDGTVDSRTAKRRAEDLADEVTGVGHVQNNLRVQSTGASSEAAAGRTMASGNVTGG